MADPIRAELEALAQGNVLARLQRLEYLVAALRAELAHRAKKEAG